MLNTEIFATWLGAAITLCCFSFLYKDNPFYRFAESLFVGVSAGYIFSIIAFHDLLKPELIAGLFPHWFGSDDPANYWLLIPGFLGCLMLFKLSPTYGWISRFTVAFIMGVTTGLVIVLVTQQMLIPQVQKAIVPLVLQDDFVGSFSNLVMFVGSICSLFYFFFSTEHRGPIYGNLGRIGIWFLMVSFGAAFGATVMGRISLLIGRFHFLIYDWLSPPLSYIAAVVGWA